MRILVRLVASAIALAVATALVPGIVLLTASTGSKVLTLGLVALLVNALLLWLTSWVAGELKLPFHITGFWPAFWGAIIISLVGWLLGILVRDREKTEEHWPGNAPA